MAQVGSTVSNKFYALLTASSGMLSSVSAIGDLAGIQLPDFGADQVQLQNVAAEVVEHSTAVRYPIIYVYCAKVANLQREKFRTFSGEAVLTVEVRVSQDRLDGLEQISQLYTDAASRVLDQSRGDWGSGVSYNGGYEIIYGPVKHGGRNFLQVAKITFTVDISME